MEVGDKRQEYPRDELDEATVGDQAGKIFLQVHAHMLVVVTLEVALAHLVEVDHDGHDFTRCQSWLWAAFAAWWQLLLLGPGFKRAAEVVNVTEQFK